MRLYYGLLRLNYSTSSSLITIADHLAGMDLALGDN